MELRDADIARQFLLKSLLWQRGQALTGGLAREMLQWAFDLAHEGEPLPPLGFLADAGALLQGRSLAPGVERTAPPGAAPDLLRRYEDYVLGKLLADASCDRICGAIARYSGDERQAVTAFALRQLSQRTGAGQVTLSAGVLKSLLARPADELLDAAWNRVGHAADRLEWLPAMYETLIHGVRNTGDLFGREDVFELERGTALAKFSQRIALRQTLHAAAALEQTLPVRCPHRAPRGDAVPTHLLDEDAYPVGGFSSIATRGSIESLLHSQLAYMERDERPDLFDVKFLRDELYYYARDENQFLRRRRTIVIALFPDLAAARVKDVDLPWQRKILVLALVVALVQRLTDWLAQESLEFAFRWIEIGQDSPLDSERELLTMLFREEEAQGIVTFDAVPLGRLVPFVDNRARRSTCQLLTIGSAPRQIDAPRGHPLHLLVDSSRPTLHAAAGPVPRDDDAPLETWRHTLLQLLERCLG